VEKLIKKLVEAFGPTGSEEQVRKIIRDEVRAFSDEVIIDTLGNLIAVKRGTGDGKKIMLAAHMDEIGVAVKYIDKQGFARFADIGGIPKVGLIGSRIRFSNNKIGIIFANERELEEMLDEKKLPSLETLYIDMGVPNDDEFTLRVGDCAVFERPMIKQGNKIFAKALDDRIGCAVLIETLKQTPSSANDIFFVFTVQEEGGSAGALTGAYSINPDIAIAVDVTVVGDSPDGWFAPARLGDGPVITLIDNGIFVPSIVKDGLIDAANEIDIPYQFEVLDHGATDASMMQLVRKGVLAGNVCIPCRYIHSPSEMVDLRDVDNTVKLLLQYIKN